MLTAKAQQEAVETRSMVQIKADQEREEREKDKAAGKGKRKAEAEDEGEARKKGAPGFDVAVTDAEMGTLRVGSGFATFLSAC